MGYASVGIDEPNIHTKTTEIYLIARGRPVIQVEAKKIALSMGDILVVEPGEAHTFLESSADYRHFVIHTPGSAGEKARFKIVILREQMGL